MFTTLQNEKLKHKDVIFQCFSITVISSSNKYLLRICYVPGAILGTGDAAANKTNGIPALMELTHAAHTRE